MIVKDVVQEMLDEDMIIQEKVGTNMLYWIFPSQSYMLVYTLFFMFIYQKKRKLDSLRKEAELARAEKAQLDESIAKAKASKPESVFMELSLELQEHRCELLRQYEEYKKKEETLQSQLDSMKERDPETIRMMSGFGISQLFLEDDVKRAVEGANRWTGLCQYS